MKDRDGALMVRVGGGYMEMEEFLRTHFSNMNQYVMVNNTDGRAAVVLDREVRKRGVELCELAFVQGGGKNSKKKTSSSKASQRSSTR